MERSTSNGSHPAAVGVIFNSKAAERDDSALKRRALNTGSILHHALLWMELRLHHYPECISNQKEALS